MKIVVCGGRTYENRVRVFWALGKFHAAIGTLITGGCPTGADAFAEAWAKENGIECRVYKADWLKHRRAAGPIRNQEILDKEQPDLVIAFPGGAGTTDMIIRAKRGGFLVLPVYP